jgi:hypothetical protein
MIYTFYSYKGGVGRSMALANIGDMLARAGLRVLMIDFDLEAPGLELFFQIDHKNVGKHLGLLDLLVSYKQDMSRSVMDDDTPMFRRLQELFIVPVYPQLPSGGQLDLLNAGQRFGEEQLSRYALTLRTFDWQDFYFNWAGELFFDWLRNALVPLMYDVVLVDSRTGVTEMGGICAYQLADVVVLFCATNRQNLQGTRNVIENFFSPRVQALRHNRPLQVLAAPSRVEQKYIHLLKSFQNRFENTFEPYLPPQLKAAGLSFWDLVIPYDPHYSFEEQVVAMLSSAKEKRQVASAYENLVEAMILLAVPESAISRLRPKAVLETKQEPQYDITQQTAGYDVFLSYVPEDREAVQQLVVGLREAQMVIFDAGELGPGNEWAAALERALDQSRNIVIVIGPSGNIRDWQRGTLMAAIARVASSRQGFNVIPVLLPGSDPNTGELSSVFADFQYLDFRSGLDTEQAMRTLVQRISGRSAQVEIETVAPYRGLNAFSEQDADLFYGRESAVAELVQRMSRANFLAILGASGSGKSSLVMAGLIPKLRRGALSGSGDWRISRVRPGTQPLRALSAAASTLDDPEQLTGIERELASNPRGLLLIADQLGIRQAGSRWLLVIDQFEEIWTQTTSPHEGVIFFKVLLETATAPNSPIILLIILRADFLSYASARPELRELIQDNQYLLGPMGRNELREAIEKPARKVGLAFEPGLIERLLDDMGDEPGNLPLLQLVLSILWERRRSGFLTLKAYAEVGGIRGALAYFADEAYKLLNPQERDAARDVLLRLVQPGVGTPDTRRRATIDELLSASSDPAIVNQVIRKLTNARILVTSVSEASQSCELAHEALIHGWPLLQSWINENRQALLVRRQLSDSAREWDRLGRDEDLLYRGVRLAQAQELAHSFTGQLNDLELGFLQASQALAENEAQAREAQRQRELEFARKIAETEGLRAEQQALSATRLRWLLIVATLAALVAIALGLIAVTARQTAVNQAATATNALGLSQQRSTLLVEEAATKDAFLSLSQDQGTALAHQSGTIEAGAISARVTAEAQVYYQATANARIQDERDIAIKAAKEAQISQQAAASSVSPDGRYLLNLSTDGTVRLWDLSTSALVATLGEKEAITTADFSPGVNSVATGDIFGWVRLYEISTGMEIMASQDHKGIIRKVAFSPDGNLLASADDVGMGVIRNFSSEQPLVEIFSPSGEPLVDIGFTPDARNVVTTDINGQSVLWDTQGNYVQTLTP